MIVVGGPLPERSLDGQVYRVAELLERGGSLVLEKEDERERVSWGSIVTVIKGQKILIGGRLRAHLDVNLDVKMSPGCAVCRCCESSRCLLFGHLVRALETEVEACRLGYGEKANGVEVSVASLHWGEEESFARGVCDSTSVIRLLTHEDTCA